jgi:nucleotide-binding universal stress UspA family protein
MGRTAAAPRRIVVGVAGSAASAAAVTWAAREAELRGAVLHAVHAWEPAARGRAPYAPGPRAGHGDHERNAAAALLRTVVQQGLGAVQVALARLPVRQGLGAAHDGLGRLPGAVGLAGPPLGRAGPLLEVAEGPAVQILLHSAAGAELLVLGGGQAAEQAAGRPSADLGPVARACLRAAPCPVVTVSPQHVRHLAPGLVRSLVGAVS